MEGTLSRITARTLSRIAVSRMMSKSRPAGVPCWKMMMYHLSRQAARAGLTGYRSAMLRDSRRKDTTWREKEPARRHRSAGPTLVALAADSLVSPSKLNQPGRGNVRALSAGGCRGCHPRIAADGPRSDEGPAPDAGWAVAKPRGSEAQPGEADCLPAAPVADGSAASECFPQSAAAVDCSAADAGHSRTPVAAVGFAAD